MRGIQTSEELLGEQWQEEPPTQPQSPTVSISPTSAHLHSLTPASWDNPQINHLLTSLVFSVFLFFLHLKF